MKVIYQTCCGVDVHKTFLVATIIKTNGGVQPSYQKQRFSTFNSSIKAFKQWLLNNACYDVCTESTGKYWIPILNLLEDQINVTVANPKWVKAVKGNKDDVKDSKWIGDLFRLGLVPCSFSPQKIFAFLGNTRVIALSSFQQKAMKRIDFRIHLQYAISLLTQLYLMSLGSLHLISQIT